MPNQTPIMSIWFSVRDMHTLSGAHGVGLEARSSRGQILGRYAERRSCAPQRSLGISARWQACALRRALSMLYYSTLREKSSA